MNIGITEFLETLDCDLMPIGNIKSFKDFNELLDVYNISTGDETLDEDFKLLQNDNDMIYLLVDRQLSEVRGIYKDLDIPSIVENVSPFVEDTYFKGITEGCVNQIGMDIDLPDSQFETLLEHLDNNNENNRLCSEYLHESVRAIVNPNRFADDIGKTFIMRVGDKNDTVTVEVSKETDTLYRVCMENQVDKTVLLIDCNYDIQEVVDYDFSSDVITETLDFMRDSKFLNKMELITS